MIRAFEECLEEGAVQKQPPDSQKAHALMSKAGKRLAYVKERPIRQDYAEFAFEDAYDVMREASTALMSLRGFKPLSHEAVIAYLKDKEGLNMARIMKFDGFRRLRNRSLYEAQEISAAKAGEALQFAEKLLDILQPRLKP